MYAGPPSGHFHSQPEWCEGVLEPDLERGLSEHSDPLGVAPYWAVPQASSNNRPVDMESILYARRPYAGGGYMPPYASDGATSTMLRPPHHAQLHTVTASAIATGPFSALASHASHAHPRHLFDRMVRPDSLSSGSPFGVGPNGNLIRLGIIDGPSHDTAGLPTSQQAWEDTLLTAFEPRTDSPRQGHSREASEPTRIPPRALTFVSSDVAMGPAHPPIAGGEDDVDTFVCEWTDEGGTCNMEVLGDRIWVSHHLSHVHHVVGHEKSQRACLWLGCTDTMNKGSLARHVVSRHLRAGTSCAFCSKVYSRADVARRHTKKCKAANGVSLQHDQTK